MDVSVLNQWEKKRYVETHPCFPIPSWLSVCYVPFWETLVTHCDFQFITSLYCTCAAVNTVCHSVQAFRLALRVEESPTLGVFFMYMDHFPFKPHPNPRKHHSNRIKSRINQFPCIYWWELWYKPFCNTTTLEVRDQFQTMPSTLNLFTLFKWTNKHDHPNYGRMQINHHLVCVSCTKNKHCSILRRPSRLPVMLHVSTLKLWLRRQRDEGCFSIGYFSAKLSI